MPAKYSKSAGIPAVNICMNCHSAVVEASRSGEFEIRKLMAAYEQGRPIEWTRVNNLPDNVYFSHKTHYKVGGIDCAECHGKVEEHDQFVQEQELSMKWCLDCHAESYLRLDENNYYNNYQILYFRHDGLGSDSVSMKQIGGWECMKCHY
jgi:hypothetical protein